MGRTIPSFRIALEGEIATWAEFRKALKSRKSREMLERVFNQARTNASYSSMAVRPMVFEGLVAGVVVSQASRMDRISKEIEKLRAELRSPSS